jgi:hypothetical protein
MAYLPDILLSLLAIVGIGILFYIMLLLMELRKVVISGRKIIERLEMLSDIKGWLDFIRKFSKKK